MKILAVIFLVLIAVWISIWISKPYEREELTFPHEMILVDNQERSIDVTLTGRTEEIVFFQKKDSLNAFEYEISKLSLQSQKTIRSLPVIKVASTVKDIYVVSREQEIIRLEKKIRYEEHKLQKVAGDSARTNGILNEIERLNSKIADEIKDIEDFYFYKKQ